MEKEQRKVIEEKEKKKGGRGFKKKAEHGY